MLCNPTNFSFNPRSVILARVNRAELGEFDALVVGLLLMAQFKGQIVVSDLGFYGRDLHTALLRENRLIAGVNFLDELPPKLRQMVALTETVPSGTTFEDAETLALYAGLIRGTNQFNDFVQGACSWANGTRGQGGGQDRAVFWGDRRSGRRCARGMSGGSFPNLPSDPICSDMKEGDKHHYIPKFYLKQWIGEDEKLCEFSRPHKVVKPRRTDPDGTGYERGLYTFPNLPPVAQNAIEKKLLQMADDKAASVLKRILAGDMDLDEDARSAWSRFLMSLMHRNPERIAQLRAVIVEKYPEYLDEIRDNFDEIKHPDDPRSFEEVRLVGAKDLDHVHFRLLAEVIDSQEVGKYLNNMFWGMIRFHRAAFPLLTSDRPTIMTNGIRYSGSHIVLPISPAQIFVAAATRQGLIELNGVLKHSDTPKRLNDLVARQARRYVYGRDDAQLRFVENRLGQKIKCSPFE